ncbi:MAG: hypothetical protein EOP51_19330 [Sphingobacteriales bacterium]|nr:MAG: hypothetical protein EOP51_19330 [Sphingobacteriales bacterium]
MLQYFILENLAEIILCILFVHFVLKIALVQKSHAESKLDLFLHSFSIYRTQVLRNLTNKGMQVYLKQSNKVNYATYLALGATVALYGFMKAI